MSEGEPKKYNLRSLSTGASPFKPKHRSTGIRKEIVQATQIQPQKTPFCLETITSICGGGSLLDLTLQEPLVFLGVPYATPPVQSNRFSPTRTPSPWDGVRVSDKMGPVCPQRLPNISNETAALERMPKGRLEYLKRLLPLLKNQSEDCLYLNIFSPAQAKLGALRTCLHSSYALGLKNLGNSFDITVVQDKRDLT
ncbi:unnamed protein product [Ceutorhynchus assimilis]|uniref:Carboxylesterase type B domain-containing protein n=1 Tax=Ceutorhynchus assimilis TaxID=467358 RepID=A0A9N9MSQ5_9CUCU|nr:unnamed protein product [Ceutorhynchus assimilis]